MAPITLFCSVQKYFKAMGFYAPLQPNERCAINRENGFYTFATAGAIIPASGFLFFEAESAYEYSVTFYVSITMAMPTVAYIIFLYRMRSIINLIENFQVFIDKRKCGFDFCDFFC